MIEAASTVKSVSVTPYKRNGRAEFYFTTITMADGTVYRGLRVYPDGSTYYYDPADTDPMHGKVSVPFQALNAKDRKTITDAAVASVQDYPNRHIGVEDLTSIAEKLGYTTDGEGERSWYVYTGESYKAVCAFRETFAWCSIQYLDRYNSPEAYSIKFCLKISFA